MDVVAGPVSELEDHHSTRVHRETFGPYLIASVDMIGSCAVSAGVHQTFLLVTFFNIFSSNCRIHREDKTRVKYAFN